MSVLLVAAVVLVCRLVDRRPGTAIGLPPDRAPGRLGFGVLLWLGPARSP